MRRWRRDLTPLERVRAAAARAPSGRALSTGLVAPEGTRPIGTQLVARTSQHVRFGARPAVEHSGDLARIIAIPRRPQVDVDTGPGEGASRARADALVALMNERLRRDRTGLGPCACKLAGEECIESLLPAQAWALYEAGLTGGVLGAIGVGHGKTGLDILAALVVPDCRRAVLLVPPGLRGQLVRDYKRWREHFRVPSLVMEDSPADSWLVTGAPFVSVVPFSKFSRPEATTLLEALQPDLIIIDEAHKARNAGTATTRRILRYFTEHSETRLCCWSGTLTGKSIRDYSHLAALSLRERSPLPLDPNVVGEWALAIDPSDWVAPMGALVALCERGEHLHKAYHRRFVETRGVIATRAGAIGAALNLHERPATAPAEILRLIRQTRADMQRPDGEELVEKLDVARCARELASGFFYRWKFPKGEPEELIDEWFRARKAWHKELREKLKGGGEHLDSPFLCAKAAIRFYQGDHGSPYRGDLPVWDSSAWPDWREVKGLVEPVSEAVWVDEYLAQDAAEWARKERGIVWYEHGAFGRKVSELSGCSMHGGGPDAEARILAETGERSIIASIASHGTGRDGLQRVFSRQLVANPPAGGDRWEQLLGRLHRIGQRADEVETWVYRHTDEMADAIDRAVVVAKYIQGTLGTNQKLLTCSPSFALGVSHA